VRLLPGDVPSKAANAGVPQGQAICHQSELVEIAGSDTLIPEDQPTELARLIRQFIGTID